MVLYPVDLPKPCQTFLPSLRLAAALAGNVAADELLGAINVLLLPLVRFLSKGQAIGPLSNVSSTIATISLKPTLFQFPYLLDDGVEQERIAGWLRTDWERVTGQQGIGAELPEYRPGCGSRSVDPLLADELAARFSGSRLSCRRVELAELEDEMEVAFERGWTSFKLYFMVGLPTETMEDVEGIITLVKKVRATGTRASGKKPMIRISVSTFVPKPHTPFQWESQASEEVLNSKHEVLRQGLRQKSTKLSWTDPKISLLEAVLSRGDRRLGRVIHHAWRSGSVFDAWSEHFNYENWLRAFAEAGLEPGFYAYRERSLDEVLPWAHIDTGVSTTFLKREYERTYDGRDTPDCRFQACNACGLEHLQPNCRQRSQCTSQSRQ